MIENLFENKLKWDELKHRGYFIDKWSIKFSADEYRKKAGERQQIFIVKILNDKNKKYR